MNKSNDISALQGQWNYPTQIYFGVGQICRLPSTCRALGMKNPLVVTDKGLSTIDFIGQILEMIKQEGLSVSLFADVDPNPTGSNIEAGIARYRAGQHDGVVAVGGGSGLDAGKAIALMAGQDRPLWDFEDVGDNYMRASTSGIAPTIAIPTTSGTGSEVGRASVIIDERDLSKKIIFHPNMLPNIVIADPELTTKLPSHITAATGMDAFVHNMEAYLAPGYHPMADAIALEGMRLVTQWLPQAYEDGDNLAARSHMMVASSMGATAFQKGLGGVHALAHPLGARFGAHHGLLNAILLPYVLSYNRPFIEDKIAAIAYHLRLPMTDFDNFMGWLQQFTHQLGIPANLRDIGIDSRDNRLIGELATKDPSACGNPTLLDADQYSSIFINAVEG